MAVAAEREAPTVRAILSEFVDEVLDASTEEGVSRQDLVALAADRFLDSEEFLLASGRDVLSQLLPTILQQRVQHRRDWIETARGGISRARLEKTARERFGALFENVDGRYRSVLTLRRPEIFSVVADRRVQIAGDIRRADALEALGKLLKNDTMRLDELPSAKLDAVWRQHFVRS